MRDAPCHGAIPKLSAGASYPLYDLLERRDEIGTDHLKSAHNLISNLAAAYDESYDADDRSGALYRAVLRDLRDELETVIQA